MPNVMSMLQGMGILELIDWMVARTFFWCGQNNIISIILFLEIAELFFTKILEQQINQSEAFIQKGEF